jgi:N-terminal domain of (some) glycogen debranching enzymes
MVNSQKRWKAKVQVTAAIAANAEVREDRADNVDITVGRGTSCDPAGCVPMVGTHSRVDRAHAGEAKEGLVTEVWVFDGDAAPLGDGTVTLVEGTSFCLCDNSGNIGPGAPQGLFFRDTRILSTWQLRIDDDLIEPLTVIEDNAYDATFVGRRARAQDSPTAHCWSNGTGSSARACVRTSCCPTSAGNRRPAR